MNMFFIYIPLILLFLPQFLIAIIDIYCYLFIYLFI